LILIKERRLLKRRNNKKGRPFLKNPPLTEELSTFLIAIGKVEDILFG
jgi:hypothetical protein